MPEFLSLQKQRELISTFPEHVNERDIIRGLVRQGYELEGLNTEFSPVEAIKNIPESGKEFVKNIWAAISKPGQTIDALSNVALGGIQKLVPGEQSREEAFNQVMDFFKERYGSKDKILNTIEQDPVGFFSDAATVIGGGGIAVKALGITGKMAGLTKTASILGKVGKGITEVSRLGEPINLAGQVVKIPKNMIIRAIKSNKALGVTKLLNIKAAEFAEKGLGISPAAASKLAYRTFGEPPGQVLAKLGIKGSLDDISVQLETLAKNSKAMLDEGFSQIPTTYRNATIRKVLNELTDTIGRPKSQQLLETKRYLQNMMKKQKGAGATGLTLTEVNELKRILDAIDSPFQKSAEIAGIGTIDFGKAALKAKDVKYLRNKLQVFIENEATRQGFSNVRQLNKTTKFGTELNRLVNDVRFSLKNKKSFLDSLILQAGLAGSIFTARLEYILGAAGVTVMRRIIQAPRFRTTLAAKLAYLPDNEFNIIRETLLTGRVTPKSKSIWRKVIKDMHTIFPEMRMAGIVRKQQTEEIQK